MPFITIDTNSKTQVTEEMLEDLTDLISRKLEKPKSYIVVQINANRKMAFQGSGHNLGALVLLRSIGFNCDRKALVKDVTSFCEIHLGVEAENVNIELINMPSSSVAKGGILFG